MSPIGNMNRRRKASVLVAAVLAITFLAPVIPAKVVSYSNTSSAGTGPPTIPPVNWGVLTDPSGTYWFHSLSNGTYAMNLTSYERLLNDPYSTHPSDCPHTIEGNIILISCPSVAVPHNPDGPLLANPSSPVSPSPNGLDSLAYWFAGHGPIYFGGKFLWG